MGSDKFEHFRDQVNVGDLVRFDYDCDFVSPRSIIAPVQGYVGRLGCTYVTILDEPVDEPIGFFRSLFEKSFDYGQILSGYEVLERAEER